MVTIEEIARICNVSKMTVARAFNDKYKHKVSPQTRNNITAVANKFNYRPNALGRAFSTGKTLMIGMLFDSFVNPFVGEIFLGMQKIMLPLGYDFLALQWTPELRQGDRLLRSIVDRRLEGIVILQGDETKDYQYLQQLQIHGIPVIAIDREVPLPDICFVGSDDAGGAAAMTNYLLSQGHQRIVFLTKQKVLKISTTRKRFEGYKNTMIANGVVPLETWVIPEYSTIDECYKQIELLLSKPHPPTAVFADNDQIAGDLLTVALNLGMKLPHDLSIAGFCDSPESRFLRPKLTTVRQAPFKIGQTCAELMLKLIEQKDNGLVKSNEVKKVFLPTELVIRESVARKC